MFVYLDESGDTGWTFTAPYRRGGSSRYLCLAFLFVPHTFRKAPKKVITDLYKKYGWIHEQKASKAIQSQKLEFCTNAISTLKSCKDIFVDCIVVKKENVQSHIRSDPNKLYNYMCKLVMVDRIRTYPQVEFIPDKRSVKVESGNSLSDYLQTVLWFDFASKTKLINNPQESDKNYNLQFVDWVANTVWSHYEDNEDVVYRVLRPHIVVRQLFF